MVQSTNKMDWKKMGFKTEAEYNKFLEDKWQTLKIKIQENIDVFKRLSDK
jgi:hypothetical protein